MDYKKLAEDALRERASIFEQRKSVADDATLTDAQKAERFEKMDADMDRLAAEARGYVKDGETEAEMRDLMERAGKLAVPGVDRIPGSDERSLHDDLRAVLSGDVRSLTLTPSQAAFRAAIAGTAQAAGDSAWMGTLGQDTFVRQILESMEESSEILSRVRKISTSSGENMDWPRRVSRAGGTFKSIAEAGTYGKATNGSFERFTLSAHKVGAIAEVTEEALTDIQFPVAEIVAGDLGEDLAESLAECVVNGTVSGGPTFTDSLLDAMVLGSNIAAAGAPTFDELIDLQHAIIAKYRRNAAFYLNDTTAKGVRKVKDLEDNYIWQPAVIAGQPDLLLGKPVFTDPLVPTTGLSAKVAWFGDLNRAYVLRTVRSIEVVRSTEYGFDRDTLALKIKWRGDGGVTDDQAVAALKNPAA